MDWTTGDWERLGAWIRTTREVLGYTRDFLAAKAEVSPRTIQYFEEGRVPGRWPPTLSRVEKALGWSPGTMRKILDGGEPPRFGEEGSLFPSPSTSSGSRKAASPLLGDTGADFVITDESGTGRVIQLKTYRRAGAEVGSSYPSAEELAEKVKDLHIDVWDLRRALNFGVKSVEQGAPYWLGLAFDRVLEALLVGLIEDTVVSDRIRKTSAQELRENGPLSSWRAAVRDGDQGVLSKLGAQEEREVSQEASVGEQLSVNAIATQLFEVQEALDSLSKRVRPGPPVSELARFEYGDIGQRPEDLDEGHESIGELLRTAREKSGKTLEEVRKDTATSVFTLNLMEENRFEVLESWPLRRSNPPKDYDFVTDKIRLFAMSVGLAPNFVVDRYQPVRGMYQDLARKIVGD